MPVEKNQVSFAGGELSPALYAHTDLVKYATGLRKILNGFVHIQGGISNRAGFEYLNSNKDHTKRAMLIPFQFGVQQNYILEFTENMMRVFVDGGLALEPAQNITAITKANPAVVTVTGHGYSNGDWVYIESVGGMTEVNNKFYKVAGVTANTFQLNDTDGNAIDSSAYTTYTSGGTSSKIFETTHDYTEDDLRIIKYTQSADVMTLVHPSYNQAELSRTAHYAWTFADIEFEPEIARPTNLAATASTAGTETYRYQVTAVSGETGEESLTAVRPGFPITGITQANPAVVTVTGHGLATGDEVEIISPGGMVEINGQRSAITYINANQFSLDTVDSSSYTAYTSGGFAPPTFFELTSAALSSANTVTTTVNAVTGAGSYNFYRQKNGVFGYIGTSTAPTFKDDNINPDLDDSPPIFRNPFLNGNYPGAVTIHKQRRIFGGSNAKPQTLEGTQVGNYYNMNKSSPARDDDSFSFTLDSEQVQQIRHLTSLKKLIAFTSGSTWLIKGGSDSNIITPTSVDADEEFVSGCSHIRPLRIGRDILYVEDGGKDILYLNYSFDADGLDGEPLTLLSNHLFRRREVLEWAYTRKPYSIIWCVCDTGELIAMTFNRKQQIWAWHVHETDGYVESVASIQEGGEDYLYASIRREIDGNVVRYTERMHSRNFQLVEDGFFVDSGLTLDTWNKNTTSKMRVTGGTDWTTDESLTLEENSTLSPFTADSVGDVYALRIKNNKGEIVDRCNFEVTVYNSATNVTVRPTSIVPTELQGVYTTDWSKTFTTISGLEHLEGKVVSILADGNVDPQQTVTSGALPNPLSAPTSKAHVGLPYNMDVETLDIDLSSNGIPTKTKKKGISEVTVYVEESRGLFAGSDADNLEEYLQRDNEDYNDPINLLTGQAAIAINPHWSDGGRVFIRQSDPLPLTLLAIIPEVEISD